MLRRARRLPSGVPGPVKLAPELLSEEQGFPQGRRHGGPPLRAQLGWGWTGSRGPGGGEKERAGGRAGRECEPKALIVRGSLGFPAGAGPSACSDWGSRAPGVSMAGGEGGRLSECMGGRTPHPGVARYPCYPRRTSAAGNRVGSKGALELKLAGNKGKARVHLEGLCAFNNWGRESGLRPLPGLGTGGLRGSPAPGRVNLTLHACPQAHPGSCLTDTLRE